MNEQTKYVFNGFLKLRNLERLELVNAINEFFDSNEREKIRSDFEDGFESNLNDKTRPCTCCGRVEQQ